jgi:hypothetical protein
MDTYRYFHADLQADGTCLVFVPITNQGPAAECRVQFGIQTWDFPPIGNVHQIDEGPPSFVGLVEHGDLAGITAEIPIPANGYAAYAKIIFTLDGKDYLTKAMKAITGIIVTNDGVKVA